jgi:two-component system, LytTR family, sensor kinase
MRPAQDCKVDLMDADIFPVRRAMLMACGIALVLALAVSAQVYLSMLSHGHSFIRLFAWQLVSWEFWGLVSPLVLRMGGCLNGSEAIRRRLLGVAALGIVLIAVHVTIETGFALWVRPFYPLRPVRFLDGLLGALPSHLVVDTFLFSLLLIGGNAYCANRRARRHDLRESRLEAELARAQLDALRLEIQPHFLFNTLNSVAALIRLKDQDGALKMLLGLSDLLRTAVERPKHQLVALSAEIEFVKRYVDLQHVRFADRLQVQYEVAEGCDDVAVPTFLLQPLVENAMRHGASPRPGTCHVQIGACTEAGRLRLWVTDDGVGLPHGFDLTRDAGTGLNNTRSRLAQLYGTAASFDVRPGEAVGTIVEIAFPFSTPLRTVAAAS